jgi:predicted metal-binding membrane protein
MSAFCGGACPALLALVFRGPSRGIRWLSTFAFPDSSARP